MSKRARCPVCTAFQSIPVADPLPPYRQPDGTPQTGSQGPLRQRSCLACGYSFWEPVDAPWREALHYKLVGYYPVWLSLPVWSEHRWGVTPGRLREAQKAVA